MASDLSISAPSLLPSTPALVSSSPPLSISHQIGISILVLAFVFGFPGNLFVVWSVLCRVRHRSVTCLLVLNLAAADALVLLSAPLFLHFLAGRRGWEFGAVACKTVHYLCCVNMNVSIYLICLMSMDRWLAVARPFLSQRMRTKKTLMAVLLAIWVLAFVLALPMPFYRSNLKPFLHKNISMSICMPYHWGSVGHQVFQYLFETVLGFFLPFTFIIVCYTSVICRLRSVMFQRKGRGNRLILLIIGAFALFWLPYHLVNILQVIGLLGSNGTLSNAAVLARPNVTAFAFLSSSVNPVLYVFAGSSHIRQAGLSFMAKLFEGTNSEGGTSASFSRSTRCSRSGSTAPDESSALRSLTLKLGWLGKEKDGGGDSGVELRGVEVKVNSKQELKTLTSSDQSE
ncbi:leukotriene B4 receptor 1 [Oncorhynchus mykiss]|uniref:Leukotriene B4 receptor n=1 Tax=Oncorhynchus mykiss TaxID=8022 RepID=A0A8K9X1A2_ONCMY|nr:leukotriene B4 receptor 1 [Oncorhynchus mykiss]XP_036843279.1 leukotriene B4 receptor 1 [Oncorhynchus mykiss]XP_036843280.1 leukotriene B4 receptor 1 [Oncorhynchus mykiss]